MKRHGRTLSIALALTEWACTSDSDPEAMEPLVCQGCGDFDTQVGEAEGACELFSQKLEGVCDIAPATCSAAPELAFTADNHACCPSTIASVYRCAASVSCDDLAASNGQAFLLPACLGEVEEARDACGFFGEYAACEGFD